MNDKLASEQVMTVSRVEAEQLDLAIKAARLGTWTLDIRTNAFTTSDLCRRDYGWLSDAPFTFEDLLGLIHPDDRARRDQKVTEAFATRQDLDIEYRVRRPDGEIAWLLVRGRAQYDASGAPITAMGVSIDITERKQAEARQNALISELNHRVKNTLSMVQSIALQTSMGVQAPPDFLTAFDGRIQALVRAHDLLTANAWSGARLDDVLRRTMAAHGAERVTFDGPPVRISSEPAVTLHMVFHELATNAAKYGALSTPTGVIDVTWTIDRTTSPAIVSIAWRERDGPPVAQPKRRGFGSNLLQTGLAREFGGQTQMTFAPDGLVCDMRIPESAKLSI